LCANASDPKAAAEKVVQCVNTTVQAAKAAAEAKRNQTEQGQQQKQSFSFPGMDSFKNFCAAKNSCVDALKATAGCNETSVWQAIKKSANVTGQCVKQEVQKIKANKEDVAASIDQCKGVNLTHEERGHKGYKGGKAGKEGKSGNWNKQGGPGGDKPHGGAGEAGHMTGAGEAGHMAGAGGAMHKAGPGGDEAGHEGGHQMMMDPCAMFEGHSMSFGARAGPGGEGDHQGPGGPPHPTAHDPKKPGGH